MPIITCPKCHNSYEVPNNMINRNVQCGFCSCVFTALQSNSTIQNDFTSTQDDTVMCSCNDKLYTKKQILEIAKNQKWFIFFILLFFAFQGFSRVMWDRFSEIDSPLAFLFRFLLILGAITFFIVEAYFCIKMMLALQMNMFFIVVLAILSVLPCTGIFIAVFLNSNANKVLTAAGLNVGFFGVPLSTIEQLQNH